MDKVYRAQRKQQRLARQQRKQNPNEDDSSSSSESNSGSSEESEEASVAPRRQNRKGMKKNTAPRYNDMYKRMDGLALVCLGKLDFTILQKMSADFAAAMVIQEHAYDVLKATGMDPNWVALEAQMISEADADKLRSELENRDATEITSDEEEEEEEEEEEDGTGEDTAEEDDVAMDAEGQNEDDGGDGSI